MSKVLLPDGKPVGPVITDVKKAHDPDELAMHQKRMNDLFKEIIGQYVAGTKAPDRQVHIVKADKDAAKKVATDRWEGAADTFNASSVAAKPVDRDMMAKAIDEYEEDMRLHELHSKPISQVGDLTEFGFLPVGIIAPGELWISLMCAVCISEKGNCLIWLRSADDTDEDWCCDWLPTPATLPLMRAPGYTLSSLKSMLQHVGVQRIIPPTELQMVACRVHAETLQLTQRFSDTTVVTSVLSIPERVTCIIAVAALVAIAVKLWMM